MTDQPRVGERITVIEARGYWRREHWMAEDELYHRPVMRDEPMLPATYHPTGERDRDGYRVYRSKDQVSPDGVTPSDFLPPPAPVEWRGANGEPTTCPTCGHSFNPPTVLSTTLGSRLANDALQATKSEYACQGSPSHLFLFDGTELRVGPRGPMTRAGHRPS